MPDEHQFAPLAGVPLQLAADLDLVLAPNPSPMTAQGTNSYILGRTELTVIDPGPDSQDHLAALLQVINGRPVRHILVTHSHKDHASLARQLAAQTNAPIYAFGDSFAGRSEVMARCVQDGLKAVGEGVDHNFRPDVRLACGAQLATQTGPITAIHTPGHMGNHMCFRWQDVIFTGDHIMGWASSMISPPDGDLDDFLRACRHLQTLDASVFYPGHGAPVHQPKERVAWLIQHRLEREHQILGALDTGPATSFKIAKQLYQDAPSGLLQAAERNVLAHLIALSERNLVSADRHLNSDAVFSKIGVSPNTN